MAEPFKGLFTQGMVTHETYRAGDGSWLSPDEVRKDGDDWVHIESGHPVTPGRIEKMSKSKRNTVDPEPILAKYGADAVRWFMLSDSPPERDLEWSEAGIEGASRFVQRVWRLADTAASAGEGEDEALKRKLHRTIAAVGEAIDGLAVQQGGGAALRAGHRDREGDAFSHARARRSVTLVLLIAPMAPHLAEEGWALLGGTGMVADAAWPAFDPALARRRRGDARDPGQRQAARHADRAARARPGGRRGARARVRQGPAAARRRCPAQGDCGSRPAGEYRRMMARGRSRCLILAVLALPACGLRPLYGGGSGSAVAATLRSVEVAPIAGQSGWLVRNKLVDRLGEADSGAPAYRLDVTLDDNITASASAATRRPRASGARLRARYQLVSLRNGTVVLDATAGSDAGIDIVSSEYATVAAEQTALEQLSGTSPTRSSLGSRSMRVARIGASEGQQAGDRPRGRPARPRRSASICFMGRTTRSRARSAQRLLQASGASKFDRSQREQ